MQDDNAPQLEQALSRTETDIKATRKAAGGLMNSLRKLSAAAETGNLLALDSAVSSADAALTTLQHQFEKAKDGWRFNIERYFEDGLFSKEVLAAGRRIGVSIYERDRRLYCYPVSVRVSAKEKAVFINKKRESRIRPSFLVSRLRDLQQKKPAFKAEAFLEALFKCYTNALASHGRAILQVASVVPLFEIYELFTLLPGQENEYTKLEFARDIYTLHKSGIDTTKKGAKVSFPASTGTRTSRTLTAITETGQERVYYGVCFTQVLPKGQT